ncbi:hypothetical protein [uncultured Campylobacter sp.]|uniref:hypothetical protein n=1 Tax=uncultured Campylobacter sp. TaxID=218934 RepID=UPI002617A7D8|nr:hypothetical protein [uncultured Campylobacter sp.]
MRERAASILVELDYVQTSACDTLWRAAFVNAARAVNLTLAAGLLLNFKFRPCRAALNFIIAGAAD